MIQREQTRDRELAQGERAREREMRDILKGYKARQTAKCYLIDFPKERDESERRRITYGSECYLTLLLRTDCSATTEGCISTRCTYNNLKNCLMMFVLKFNTPNQGFFVTQNT